MSDCTGDFSIEVNETKYIIEVESCINSTGINNITLSPTSGANIEINTCQIPATHPVITPAADQDNSGNVFVQDVFLDGNGHVTGLVSASVTGFASSGDNVSIFVNDAGYMTSYTETGLNTFLTGISFNCTTKELLEHLNDGTTLTGDLSCIVVSGDNISLLTNDSGYATTGQLASTSGHLQGQIDAIPADTNTFVSGVQYDTAQRDIILTRTDSVTLTGNLDVVVHSGDNVSKLANDAGYITGYTETDPIFSASPASGITSGNITNWNEAYGWGDHSTSGYLVSGDNVSLLNNDVPYAISGSHIAVNAASDSDNSGQVFIQDLLVDEYGHVTGLAIATASGQVYTAGTGLVLAGNEFNIDETVIQSGDNVSLLANDAGYLTSGTNHSVTGASFNCTSKELYLTQSDGSTTTGDLGCVIVSGDNISLLNNDAGYITGATDTTYTAGTGLALDGTQFNISGVETSLLQGTVDNNQLTNSSFTLTAGTGLVGGGAVSLGGTGTLDIDSSVVQSGDNISVLNNDAGYITGFTETLTSLTGDSVNTKLVYTDENGVANDVDLSWAMDDTNLSRLVSGSIDSSGIATFTRDDASSFTVDFSILFDDTNLSRITSGNFDTSSGILTLTRELDDTSVSVNLDGRYITGVVQDTTPKLGGNLDAQSNQITDVSKLEITNTSTDDSLLITTTEDSSSAAPVLTFKRNSTSPNDADYIGQLKFKGENDADQEVVYAKVTAKISDASDTTEDGLIEFALRKAGSNNIGMRLTSTDLKLLNGTEMDMGSQQIHNVLDPTSPQDAATKNYCDTNFTDGSGTANYVAKWSDADTLTSGIIYDDGTGVGIGTNSIDSGDVLNVNGDAMFSGTRTVHINSNGAGEFMSKKGDSGGWAFDIRAIGNSGTIYSGLGFYGSNDSILWQFWGGSYTTPWIKQTTTETVVNETAANRDFRVEGQAETHLIFADASNSNVGIGQSAPKSRLTVTADANDEYGIRLGNAAGGGGSVTGISKLGLDHWAPTLNHPAVAFAVQETSTASYSADLHIQTRTSASDVAPDTKVTFKSDGKVGIGTDSPSDLLQVSGSIQLNGVLKNDTNASTVTQLTSSTNSVQTKRISANATFWEGIDNQKWRIASDESGYTALFDIFYSGKHMVHYGSAATIADGSSYELDISSSAATLAGNRFQILSSETVVNNAGGSLDFRVEGNTDTSLLHVDASADNVGIGVSAPTEKLHVDGIVRASGVGHDDGVRSTFMSYPGGGQFGTSSSTATGYLKITYPQSWLNVMINAEVDIYEYNNQDLKTIKFGGYQYASTARWLNTAASMDANSGDDIRYNIRFGHDGSKCAVYISKSNAAGTDLAGASEWSYPQAAIHDVHAAFSSTNATMDRWADGWDVGFETGLGTITETRYVGRAYHLHETDYVFNEIGEDVDFRVEGQNKQNLLKIDASADRIGINQGSPATLLDINAVGEGAGTKTLFKYDDQAYVSFQHSGGDFLKLGQVYTSDAYMGLTHSDYGTQSYMIMSDGAHTLISAGNATDGRIYIRGNRNDSSFEIKINPSADEIVVNDQGALVDFRVEGNTNPNLLFLDASTDRVGIGTGNITKQFNVQLDAQFNVAKDANGEFSVHGSGLDNLFYVNPVNNAVGIGGIPAISSGLQVAGSCKIGNQLTVGAGSLGFSRKNTEILEDCNIDELTINHEFTFPTGDGTNGQTLVTDGSGNVSWGAGAGGTDVVRGTVSVTTTTGIFAVGGGYTTGALDVYLNGIKLADTVDYTATNGTSISLTSPATSGDILSYVGYDRATVAGTLQDTGDTVNGNFTVNGDLVVMGYKETHTDNGSTGAAQTIAITGSTIQTFTLTNNCVFTLPSADAGRSFTILLKTGAGSFTASFTGTDPVKFPSNSAPSITTSGSRMDVFTFISDGTNWYGDSQQDYHV